MSLTIKLVILPAIVATEPSHRNLKARQFVSPDFKSELEAYEGIERLYQHGGWVIDGIESLTADGAPWSEDGEKYFWKAYHAWERETMHYNDVEDQP